MKSKPLSKEQVLQLSQRFHNLMRGHDQQQAIEQVEPALQQYRLGLFRLVVVGEIKKGKSSFINALLGEHELLPTLSDVATSTVYKIMYGPERRYKVFFLPQQDAQGTTVNPPPLDISREALADYGTEDGNPDNRKNVDFIGIQLPHPLLKAGVAIIDTPGLDGVFREHSHITWRYMPSADAIFFVLDSVEAVASKAEMNYLRKLRQMTALLFFIQTKIDLEAAEKWQQWRDRNVAIIADTLKVNPEKVLYFPVSARLKQFADEDKSPKDLNKSGFIPLLHFLHEKLLKAKERRLADNLLQRMALETTTLRRQVSEQLSVVSSTSKEELARLEQEFTQTKTQFEQWRMGDYQRLLSDFQMATSDLKRHTLNALQNDLDPSPQGPVVGTILRTLRQGNQSAKQLVQEAKAIQSDCIDRCMQQIYSLQGNYDRAMQRLIAETSVKLGESCTVRVDAPATGGGSLSTIAGLNMHFSGFERLRNAFLGGTVGGTLGTVGTGLATGLVVGLIFPPAAAFAFIAQFAGVIGGLGAALGFIGGGLFGDRSHRQRQKDEALNKLQNVLTDTVRLVQKQAIQQFQDTATGYERAANSAFQEAATHVSRELQDRLNTIVETRQRARQENQAKAAELQQALRRLDQLLRDLGQTTTPTEEPTTV